VKLASSRAMQLFAIAPLLLLAACGGAPRSGAQPAPAPGEVSEAALAAILDQEPVAGAQWGVLAVDLGSGDTLLARNAATRFLPASTMKVATALAALELLGPDFRWRTELWSSAPIDSASATLPGDLVLPGTGDPTLSPRFYPDEPRALDLLGTALRDLGVRRVTGALVIDASAWDSTTVQDTWMVGDLPFDYGATGGAFTLNEGETRIEVRGGAASDETPTIDWWPKGEDVFVISRLATADTGRADVSASYLPESRRLELTGTVPRGVVDTLAFATRDPVRQAAAALYRRLTAEGAQIDGGWRVEWSRAVAYGNGCVSGSAPPCPSGRILRGLGSPPLIDVVAGDLAPSQNWMSEQILRTLGAAGGARGSWGEGSRTARRQLIGAGVDSLDMRIVDGSGLSTQNLLTPRALVRMLQHARTRPWGEAFRKAMAEPGEEQSTLETRLTDLSGRVFAKTGTLTNVGALAGYVVDERGREIAFAILANASNLPGAVSRQAIDDVVRMLAGRR
jgi:D-alanyl-D-alanine carboxypeptidase/D-alanyl-D-alanine-endopeptidase (penicillin-binding protein 4)